MFHVMKAVLVLGISIGSLAAAQAQAQAQDAPKREIVQISGDLYRFQNKFHYSVFLVTPEGVIATDPINADAAQWLRIGGYWFPRGGIPIDVFYQSGPPPEGLWLPDQGVPPYRGG